MEVNNYHLNNFSKNLLTAALQIACNLESQYYRVNSLNEIALIYHHLHLKNKALEIISLAEVEANKVL
jgi:hypothetical protein